MNKMVVSVGVGLNFSYNKKKMNTNRGSISSRYPLVRPTKKKLEVLKSRDEKTKSQVFNTSSLLCRGRGILEISFLSSLILDEKTRGLKAII